MPSDTCPRAARRSALAHPCAPHWPARATRGVLLTALLLAATPARAAEDAPHDVRPAPPAPPASSPWHALDEAHAGEACRRQLAAVRTDLQALPTTSLMAARGDEVVFAQGRVDVPSIVHSVRKSLLAMLYGKPVQDGTIRLDDTLADLGIDDLGGLLPIERQARVRDLLAARSGVYHAAANPGDDSAAAPPRGSRKPGEYFLYNNWDFNAAGTVFEQRTGRGIHDAFARDIAVPLGLQDFVLADQHRGGDATRSRHLSYPFTLSTRDMARIGELMLAHGRWNGVQLVPADWTTRITTPVTRAADMHPPHVARRGIDYGYLWWIPEEPADSPLAGAYMAWGMYGQFILVVPKSGMVIAAKHDLQASERAHPRQVHAEDFLAVARRLAEAPCD